MAFVVTAITAGAGLVGIATAVANLGLALTAVGAVTGSKKLMKVGGFLGLAGGLGSLAAGALGGGAAAGAAAEGAAAAGGAATSGGVSSLATETLGEQILRQSPSVIGAGGTAAATGMQGIADIAGGVGNAVTAASPIAASAPAATGIANTADLAGRITAGQAAYNAANPGVFNQFKTWFSGLDPQSKAAFINTGGNMLSGLSQSWAQEKMLEQQAAQRQRELDMRQQEIDFAQNQLKERNAVPAIRYAYDPGRTGIIGGIVPKVGG